MVLAHHPGEEVWGFVAHPDVWLMVVALVGGYFAALRYLVPPEHALEPATATQKLSYLFGVAILWIGADWPLHELSEDYLFSAHMVQHTLFSLVAPPFLLLGLPAWLTRKIVAPVFPLLRFLTRPLIALVVFNAVIVVTHWPALVNAAVTSEPLHFALHVVLVSSALLMWWPVVDPLPELKRLEPPSKMLYLFLQSIVPTVPASFLTFASTPLYSAYVEAPRLWGISAITDQMVAGLIMKIVGGLLLWLAIAFLFFKWYAAEQKDQQGEVAWDDFERELEVWDLRR
ncbi:MAG TPA: cytochrome c oxidase assembly protein [Actinomycetota bacterium]|nr:cytochrome c oxidase assembly protein [Actinomycetota bacterium]